MLVTEIDRVDLHPLGVGDVRDDPVLETGLRQRDRLGGLLEQVDDRRAAEPERRRVDVLLELGRAPVEEDDHLERRVVKPPRQARCQPPRSRNRNLLRKGEELGQQPVARERTGSG